MAVFAGTPNSIVVLDEAVADLVRQEKECLVQMKAIKMRLRRLQIERETMEKARNLVQKAATPQESEPARLNGSVDVRLKPSAAVIAFLRVNPGSPAGRVVALLENEIKTTSPDRKKLLYNTIHQLKHRGVLFMGPDDRGLFVREGSSIEETEREDGEG